MKRLGKELAALLLAGLLLAGAGCSVSDRQYYSKKEMTREELIQIWGEPKFELKQKDGSILIVFDGGGFDRGRFFVLKNNRVVDGGYRFYDLERPDALEYVPEIK
ncbi:MAG: hypothetical protein V1742_00525 [Pseudomonadota bacterium]